MWGDALHRFPSLPSTQTAALAAAPAGAAEGTVFLADTQTAGRGRHGHTWSSPAGSGLYLSILLHPRRPVPAMMLFTLAAGLAVADAVANVAGLQPELRWPNDLLLAGRKFCGLLLESAGDYAALGIGVNLRPASLPPEVASVATALDDHAAAPVDSDTLLRAILAEVERRYHDWSSGGSDAALISEFERHCPYVRDGDVVVGIREAALPRRARSAGLDAAGYLRVAFADGSRGLIVTGDVRPAPARD